VRFRSRLQLLGIPLVVVPLLAALGLFSTMVTREVVQNKEELLATKLSLLQSRVASSYDVLAKVGLQDNEFFMQNARDAISRYFTDLLGQGEEYLIFTSTGEYLAGNIEPIGRSLPSSDPLHAVLSTKDGSFVGRSPFLSFPNDRYVIEHRYFAPWRWVLVLAGNENSVVGPLRGAAAVSVAVSLIFVALAGIGFLLIARMVSQPLVRLTDRVRAMGEGRLDPSVESPAPVRKGFLGESDEVGVLAAEFGSMAARIHSLTKGLETRVDERTAELVRANKRLEALNSELQESLAHVERIKNDLVETEKLAALGQLVAGIAHELNTPLGAIGSAAESLDSAVARTMDGLPAAIEHLKREELQSVLGLLEGLTVPYQREDRAALGRQREAIAAELRSRGVPEPEEGADLLMDCGVREPAVIPEAVAGSRGTRLIAAIYELSVLKRSASIIATASAQAVRVIEALRIYAHKDEDARLGPVDVARSIETILTIYRSRTKRLNELFTRFHSERKALANPEKLAQVWTNLMNNALQAMDFSGSLSIEVYDEDDNVCVDFTDDGPGIPAEIHDRIFTPFFTTKKPGEGSGLGLEICRTIVEGFGGSIVFDSRPGKTTFSVRLPAAK